MSLPTHAPVLPYYIGCPVWSCSDWVGSVFTPGTKRHEYLHQYSMAFNTVEGNSTFYGLPALDTARRWCDETLPGFKFALKFPRTISHEKQLIDAQEETRAFLTILEILSLQDRLGPSFLQLSPAFSGAQMPALADYLRELPEEFPFAIEVRHRDYFDEGPCEEALNELLTRLQMDRTIFDSRPLFAASPSDVTEQEAQRRKPKSPVRHTATGQRPMLRFVGRNDVASAQPWIEEWVPIAAQWIRDGLCPYIFTHAPDDAFAPQLARSFHRELSKCVVGMPPLPLLNLDSTTPAPRARQRELF